MPEASGNGETYHDPTYSDYSYTVRPPTVNTGYLANSYYMSRGPSSRSNDSGYGSRNSSADSPIPQPSCPTQSYPVQNSPFQTYSSQGSSRQSSFVNGQLSQQSPTYSYSDAQSPSTKVVENAPVSSSNHKKERRHNPPGPSSLSQYPCLHPNCGHISFRAHDLKRHMTVHFPPKKDGLLDCKYEWCGRTGAYGFKREDHRKEHYRKVHMKESEYPQTGKGGRSTSSSSPSLYPCLHPNCGHMSSHAHDLKRHMTVHFPPKKDELLDCEYERCGRTGTYGFKREDHRKEHYKKAHKKESEPPKTGKGGRTGRRASESAPDAQALGLSTATLAEDSNVQPSQTYGPSPVYLPPNEDSSLDCRYEWCGRTGTHGFKRGDHREEHYRKVHMKELEYPQKGKGRGVRKYPQKGKGRGSAEISEGPPRTWPPARQFSPAANETNPSILSETTIPPKEPVPPAAPPSSAALKVYGPSISENKMSPKECETTIWKSAVKKQVIPSLHTDTTPELSRMTLVELDESDSSVAFMPRPSTEDRLATIASQVLGTLVKNEVGQYCASLKLQWDILDFMEDQFRDNDSPNRDLGRVITISGSARHAQAATCSDYLRQNWPSQGLKILDALQIALNDVRGCHVGSDTMVMEADEDCGSALYCDTESGIDITQEFVFLDIKSEASGNIVDAFQQLIWLGTVLRTSRDGGIQYCEPKLERVLKTEATDSALFNVTFELRSIGEEARCCWFPLFTNPVIAFGFPTALRNDSEVGLEIPLDMMAALGGARHVVDFEGGLVMKGHSAMFVPLKRYDQSIQWHLIFRSEEHRIRYRELGKECPNRAMLNEIDSEALLSTRAFLGWWPSSETHLGTADAAYGSIDWSSAREAKRPAKLAGANIGFQTMVTGQLSFIMGAKDGRYHLSQKGPFQRKVQCADNTPVVLYDIDNHRAWLVPALNVMLHIIQTRHRLSPYKIHGKDVTLTPVNPKNGKFAATEAVTSNQLRQLYDHDLTAETKYYYKDAISDLWSQIERLMEKEDSIESGTGLALPGTMQSQIYGWEYMSLVHEKNYRRKEAAIAKTSGGWVDLIKDIDVLTLFATELGDIIKPVADLSSLCPLWRSLPKGKDYLAACVPTMELLYSEAGSRSTHEHLSTSHLQWHRGTTLFEQCTGTFSGRCRCDRTQQIYHDSLFRTFGRVRPPGKLKENGCVVFGQAYHPFKPPQNRARNRNNTRSSVNLSTRIGRNTMQSLAIGNHSIPPSPPPSVSPASGESGDDTTWSRERPPSPVSVTDDTAQEKDIVRRSKTLQNPTPDFGERRRLNNVGDRDDCASNTLENHQMLGHDEISDGQKSGCTAIAGTSKAGCPPLDGRKAIRHKAKVFTKLNHRPNLS